MGLVLLVGAFGTPLVAAWRSPIATARPNRVRRFRRLSRPAGMDWDWEMPAVTLCGSRSRRVLAGRPAKERCSGRVEDACTTRPASPFCLIASAFAFVAMNGNRALARPGRGERGRHYRGGAATRRTAARWAPWSSEPIGIQADAALERGNLWRHGSSTGTRSARTARTGSTGSVLPLRATGRHSKSALARAAQLDPLPTEIRQLRASGGVRKSVGSR